MGGDPSVKNCEQLPPVHPGEILVHDFLEPPGFHRPKAESEPEPRVDGDTV